MVARRPPGLLTVAVLTVVAVAATAGAAAAPAASPRPPAPVVVAPPLEPDYASIPLQGDGVVLDSDGLPLVVPVGAGAGGQVADDGARRAAQDAWLAAGSVPGSAEYRELAERALRDLDALVLPGGAAVAGASPYWRYVWPRDASFTAVALARTGHASDAYAILTYLQTMQDLRSTDGIFEARYEPDGSGDVPDGRGLQLDGNGWVLWATAEWYAATPPGARRAYELRSLRPLVTRSVEAIRAHVDPLTGLPDAFPDFWEVREEQTTLGTLAPLLLGARAVGPVLEALGEPPAGDVVWSLERGLATFAPDYPRRAGGGASDASVALLMPPFAPADPQVAAASAAAAAQMARPAGGLAPGADWRADGVSWTPTTALFALTAAGSGDVATATARLEWLADHRTPMGSLPEKVLWDGRPSAVAPLAWTASLVLLTLDQLDGRDAYVPGPAAPGAADPGMG